MKFSSSVVAFLASCAAVNANNGILERVVADSDLSTLSSLVVLAGLEDAIATLEETTFFAPINSAFDKIPVEKLEFLQSAAGKEDLIRILYYHAVPDLIIYEWNFFVSSGLGYKTLEGGRVFLEGKNSFADPEGTLNVNDAEVTEADILTNNGIVFKIDTVLNPDDPPVETTPTPAPDAFVDPKDDKEGSFANNIGAASAMVAFMATTAATATFMFL
jgi:uncharacterized surface protein with fasciclin (FAS1) repeats